MEKEIIKRYLKYQKTWPQPICSHERKYRGELVTSESNWGRSQLLVSKHQPHPPHPNKHDTGSEDLSRRHHDSHPNRHDTNGDSSRRHPNSSRHGTNGTSSKRHRSVGNKHVGEDIVRYAGRSEGATGSQRSEHLKQSNVECGSRTSSDKMVSKRGEDIGVPGGMKNQGTVRYTENRDMAGDTKIPSDILRSYETRSNYGTLYQIRKLGTQTTKEYTDRRRKHWFWPREYKQWRKHFKQPILADVSSSEDEQEAENKSTAKPHPDLYGVFNSVDLRRQLEDKGATDIQRLVRGWLIRRQILHLQNKASELRQSWPEGMKEYLQVRSKVRARLHVVRNDPELDLHDVRTFLEQKKEYEDIFKRLATLSDDGRSLPAHELREFFNACALNPSEREINEAFTAVFGGSTEIEVTVLLDKSSECGPLAIKGHVGVAQDIVTALTRLSATSRVSLVPFDEATDQVIQMSSEEKTGDDADWMIKTFDSIKLGNGPRNVHVGLNQLRNTFKNSSPGACRIGLVIVGGMSADPKQTEMQSRLIKQDHINLFSIGLGQKGTSQDVCPPGNSYIAAGVGAWKRMSADVLEEIISKSKFASQSQTVRYTDESCRPLTKEEALAILWTIYPPQGVAARHHRRSTWLHPIIDNEEASPALADSMKKEAELSHCIRLVVASRIARDGFIILPTDGPTGAERVHDVETAVRKFLAYLQSGKLDHLLT